MLPPDDDDASPLAPAATARAARAIVRVALAAALLGAALPLRTALPLHGVVGSPPLALAAWLPACAAALLIARARTPRRALLAWLLLAPPAALAGRLLLALAAGRLALPALADVVDPVGHPGARRVAEALAPALLGAAPLLVAALPARLARPAVPLDGLARALAGSGAWLLVSSAAFAFDARDPGAAAAVALAALLGAAAVLAGLRARARALRWLDAVRAGGEPAWRVEPLAAHSAQPPSPPPDSLPTALATDALVAPLDGLLVARRTAREAGAFRTTVDAAPVARVALDGARSRAAARSVARRAGAFAVGLALVVLALAGQALARWRHAVAHLAVGFDAACALRNDGAVVCWGSNQYGQLGDGTHAGHAAPRLVAGLRDAVQLAAAGSRACAVARDGAVYCWGLNVLGELGDGTRENRATPVRVAALPPAAQVALGTLATCARTRGAGEVYCWGSNVFGLAGDAPGVTTPPSLAPRRIALPAPATDLALGYAHACAVVRGGAVYCWGSNIQGALGDGAATNTASPVRVHGLADVVAVGAGYGHSCALRRDATVWCWGRNESGELGDGTRASGALVRRATMVSRDGLTRVAGLALGGTATCVREARGAARCAGETSAPGSSGASAAATLARFTGLRELSRGEWAMCGLRDDGAVLCEGGNYYGQLGSDDPREAFARIDPAAF